MGQCKINIAAPNLVNLCIDRIVDGEYRGRIYHQYSKEAIVFCEVSQLIFILDQFFDEINYPQASTKCNRFQKQKGKDQTLAIREKKTPLQTAQEIGKFFGEEATFILYVQFRQNSSWQGKLIWVEADIEESFYSVLEFLMLLDNALAK